MGPLYAASIHLGRFSPTDGSSEENNTTIVDELKLSNINNGNLGHIGRHHGIK